MSNQGGGLASFRQQFQQGDQTQSEYNTGGGLNFLTVSPGFNDFRLFPSTIPGNSFMYLRHVHKAFIEVTDDKGVKELKRKHIFNSRTHGETPKDLFDEYIAFTEEKQVNALKAQNLSSDQFKAQIKAAMAPIRDWKTGIQPEFKWCAYAMKLGFTAQAPVKEVEAKKGCIDFAFSVGKKIDTLAASFDRRGAVATVDPFSDRQTGGILVINYDKTKEPAEMYAVSLDRDLPRPISEEEYKWLLEQRTLEDQYVGSYTRKDFNMAVEGLQRFDQEAGYRTFQDPAFIAIMQEISQYYPQDEKVPMRDLSISTSANPLDFKPAEPVQQQPPAVQGSRHQQVAPVEERSAIQTHRQALPQQPLPAASVDPVPPVQQQAPPAAVEQQAPPVASDPQQVEREQLLNYIQENHLPITIHPQHSNSQIREFIEQELMLKDQAEQEQAAGDQQPPAQQQGGFSGAGPAADDVARLF